MFPSLSVSSFLSDTIAFFTSTFEMTPSPSGSSAAKSGLGPAAGAPAAGSAGGTGRGVSGLWRIGAALPPGVILAELGGCGCREQQNQRYAE